MIVTLVPTDHVHTVWPAVTPLMERAAALTFGRYTVDDILAAVMHMDHQLWVAFAEGPVIKGAVVTALKKYPRMLALDLVFAGGDEGMEWKAEMLQTLQAWAYDNSCDVVEAAGRLGWGKIFRDDGYKPLWQMFELPVGEAGLGG